MFTYLSVKRINLDYPECIKIAEDLEIEHSTVKQFLLETVQ